jgi:putative endonuclease
MYYTYVLLCTDNKIHRKHFYIGSTEDLKNRVAEHKSGEVKTTKSFESILLIYYEACVSKTDARKRELQLKTGFGRGFLKRRLEAYLKESNAGIV